jgi:hypothetical protein
VAFGPGLAATPPGGPAPSGPGLGRGQVQTRLAGPRTGAPTPSAVRAALVPSRPGPCVGAAVAPRCVGARCAVAPVAVPVAAGCVVARGSAAVASRRVVARAAAPVAAGRVVARGTAAVAPAWRVVARPVGPGPAVRVIAGGRGAVVLVAVLPGSGLLPRLSPPAVGSLITLPSCPFALPALTCGLLGGVAVAPPVRRRRLGSAQRQSSTSTADGSPANEAPQQARSFGRATLPSRGRWVRIFATGRLLTCTFSHCLWPALTAA